MAEILATDMLQNGLTPTDMVLLYGWAGGAGAGGLDLHKFSTSFLAAYFAQVGLAL